MIHQSQAGTVDNGESDHRGMSFGRSAAVKVEGVTTDGVVTAIRNTIAVLVELGTFQRGALVRATQSVDAEVTGVRLADAGVHEHDVAAAAVDPVFVRVFHVLRFNDHVAGNVDHKGKFAVW